MLFLQNKNDLHRILRNPALFSKEPVFLHLSELLPSDLIGYETRINLLKKEKDRQFGIRAALTTLVIFSFIYINAGYAPAHKIDVAIMLILGLSLCAGIAGMILHRLWIKNLLKREIKRLLKRLRRPQTDPLVMAMF